jgi:predicted metal-dependent hydrolase
VPGARFRLEGKVVELTGDERSARAPRIEDGRLVSGGPQAGFARRIELFLRRRALETLSRETTEFAARAGVTVRSVTVGDADTRWGSCSSSGRIRYSWRLILAPPEARRYVVAHEVAHMRHLNHGPQFKALEKDLFGDGAEAARLLLRRVGCRLKRIGRGN